MRRYIAIAFLITLASLPPSVFSQDDDTLSAPEKSSDLSAAEKKGRATIDEINERLRLADKLSAGMDSPKDAQLEKSEPSQIPADSAKLSDAKPEESYPVEQEDYVEKPVDIQSEKQAAALPKEKTAVSAEVMEEPQAVVKPEVAAPVAEPKVVVQPVPATETRSDAQAPVVQNEEVSEKTSAATSEETKPEALAPPLTQPTPVVVVGEPPKRARIPVKSGGKNKEKEAPQVPKTPNVFAEQFLMTPDQRIKNNILELNGFLFMEKPALPGQPKYFIVTQFVDGVLKSRPVPPGPKSLPELKKWIEENLKTAPFQGVEVKRLSFPDGKGGKSNIYWIGNKSFDSTDKAKAQIVAAKTAAEAKGGNFSEMVMQAQAYIDAAEAGPKIEIKTPAQYEREEKIALKFLDQLDIGNKLFGPLQGRESGEPIVWQSFGETSFRTTNIEKKRDNIQVGYWTNRLVFKGIRAPLNTIDPFFEVTPTLESSSPEYKSNLKVYAGLEWRPLERNPFINNFRPWGLPLLDWCRNWRLFVEYGDRFALKDEITGSKNYNLVYGAQIFYEWGIDLPGAGEGAPGVFADYLREFVWGEYYGDYHWESTNFGSEKAYNAWVFNSSVLLGFRLPGIPLPQNPINDRLVLMPYMKFEHVNNSEFSFTYQNRIFVAAGVRWMPFRTYKFKENEWLAKMKIFIEYDGVGGIYNPKQGDTDPSYGAVQNDFRVGVNISSRRY